MARVKIERPLLQGHVDAYLESDTGPLRQGFGAGAGYSTPIKKGGSKRVGLTYHSDDHRIGATAERRNKKGGSKRFGLTYHSDDHRINATAEFRWKKGGLVDN